jgi:hypothetical protein
MKNNKINLIFGILMLIALVGGLLLVRQNQNTQRGAYFSGTKVLVMPESIKAAVGSKAIAQLYLETENGAKLSSVDTVVCYGPGLELDSGSPETQVVLNTDVLKDLVDVSLTTIDSKPCVRIVAIAGATMKPADLKSGMVKVADIKFNAVAVASGEITIVATKTKVGGYNPTAGATDNSLKVSSVTGASYSISSGTPTIVPTTPVTKYSKGSCDTATGLYSCSEDSSGAYTSLSTCENSSGCNVSVPTTAVTRYSKGSCDTATGLYSCSEDSSGAYTSLSTCENSSGCNVSVPTQEPTSSETGDDSYLKFRMAFYGVSGSAQCADPEKLPLTVVVRSNSGVVKTYTNVISNQVNSSGDVGYYDVEMRLGGFNVRDGVAVFIKSPKSLQVKYGKDGQDGYYGVAGGELSGLTASLSTTPKFDFSKYPLLMGDITGPDGVQDGVVDGIDFSYIKTEANKRTEVASGGYMAADMNGNCKMESQDLANMMLSLSVKQGQLY